MERGRKIALIIAALLPIIILIVVTPLVISSNLHYCYTPPGTLASLCILTSTYFLTIAGIGINLAILAFFIGFAATIINPFLILRKLWTEVTAAIIASLIASLLSFIIFYQVITTSFYMVAEGWPFPLALFFSLSFFFFFTNLPHLVLLLILLFSTGLFLSTSVSAVLYFRRPKTWLTMLRTLGLSFMVFAAVCFLIALLAPAWFTFIFGWLKIPMVK